MDQNIDELKGQVEFVVHKFQEIMIKYHEIENKIDEVSKNAILQNKRNQDFEEILISLKNEMKLNAQRNEYFVKRQDELDHLQKSNFNFLSESDKIHRSHCLTLHQNFLDHKDSIDQNIKDNINALTNSQNLSIERDNNIHERISEKEKDFVILSDKVNREILLLKEELKSLETIKQNIKSLQDDVQKNIQSIAWLSNARQKDVDGILNKIEDVSKSYSNKLDQKISDIPKPEIPSLDDAKKEMKSIIDPFSIDAKNANLRSANNENKILILDKKVETLQLIIEKYQLEGKGGSY